LYHIKEETEEFQEGINKLPEIKKTWEYLKSGERIPMEEWIPYIREYNKVKNSVLEKYLKESLIEAKDGKSDLHKFINKFLQWFKDLFSNTKTVREITDALIYQALQNNKEIILGDKNLKNKEKVSLEKALGETKHGEDIINTLSKEGLILTGSISVSEQGSVYRKLGYLLHDIDWLVPYGFKGDPEKALRDKYKGTELVREFDSPTYYTKTFIVPPLGHKVVNMTFFRPEEFGERKYIAGFDVINEKTGKIVSNYRRYYDVKPISKKVVERKEVYNEGLSNVPKELNGISVDLFFNKQENKFEPVEVSLPNGDKIKIANWLTSFTEKLKYGRNKDLVDWANFIPNDFQPNTFPHSYETIREGAITPSIKGHAQFATDNGIGWVRVWYNKKTGVVEIQEIQSDLFQKWRNNFEFEGNKYTAKKDDNNVWHYYKNSSEINSNEYTKIWNTFLETYLDNADAFTKLCIYISYSCYYFFCFFFSIF